MLLGLFASADNCVIATRKLLKPLKVAVHPNTITDKVLSHPDHPSLLSISDALKSWKVPHAAIKARPEKLLELPTPFLAQIKERNQPYFVVISSFTEKDVKLYDKFGKRKHISAKKFTSEWTGIVLLAEVRKQSGEQDYQQKQRKNILTIVSSSLFFLALLGWIVRAIFAAAQSGLDPLPFSFYLLLKLSGITLTALLLWHEIDRYNPLLQSICSVGKKTNCNAVLSSKGAGLAGISNWSEVGFTYFTGTFLALLISGISSGMLTIVSWLSLAALPYVIYSISYQAFRIKQWCPLCLGVQAILIVEAITIIITWYPLGLISYAVLPVLLTTFLLPVVGWHLLGPILEKAKSAQSYKHQHARLKNNPQVFESLLTKETPLEMPPLDLGIILGNPKAPYHIIKVCNPYCDPCAQAHPILDELLDNGIIQLQIIFTATADIKDRRLYPARHLLAIANAKTELLRQALDEWYGADKKDYEIFAGKYPMNGELQHQTIKIEAMHRWCKQIKITHTPTIFINNHPLPKGYSINDLKSLFI